MSNEEHHFVAVVGIDFSAHSNHVLDAALALAGARGGELHVLYVDHTTMFESTLHRGLAVALEQDATLEQVRLRATERVAAMTASAGAPTLKRVVAHFRRGSPAEEIVQLAADVDADLVVVGSHGQGGIRRFLLGSVAERTSHLARCEVWIVRPKDHDTSGQVPKIEPPCPDCVAKRRETNGRTFWCARHSEHHVRPHTVAYVSDPFYAPESTVYKSTPQ